jgi:hypothetical protein
MSVKGRKRYTDPETHKSQISDGLMLILNVSDAKID